MLKDWELEAFWTEHLYNSTGKKKSVCIKCQGTWLGSELAYTATYIYITLRSIHNFFWHCRSTENSDRDFCFYRMIPKNWSVIYI
jgi:hypothetical protein